MTIDITEDRLLELIHAEMGQDIGVGLMAVDPHFKDDFVIDEQDEEGRLALGRFVNLMRRKRGWTMSQLAEEARVDVGDILSIEKEPSHKPEPRTLYQLSQVFGVSNQKLLGLSGLMQPKDVSYVEDAVRFAANSESIEKLSKLEREALEGFIAVLSDSTKA